MIAGHQRLVAARRAGLTTVPVILLDVTAEDARLLNVALNQIGGEWDADLLARLLIDLRATAAQDLTLSGFAEADLQDLLTRFDQREKRDRPERFDLEEALAAYDRDATGSPPAPAGSWARTVSSGATPQVRPSSPAASAATRRTWFSPIRPTTWTTGATAAKRPTPPAGGCSTTRCRRRSGRAFCRAWAASLTTNVAGALYVCMSSREWPLVCRVLAEAGAHWSDTIIWAKDRFTLGRADYQRQYEPIWYGWSTSAPRQWHGGRDQGDVWPIPRPDASPLHPTQKPLALVERAIENSSPPGAVVLDLFCGAGTTLIACERTGRRGVGVEIDPRYVAATIARWEAFTGETALPLEPKEVTDV